MFYVSCVCVCVGPVSQAEALKEENDSLRCQLDAYRNEVELLKQEQGKNQEHTPPQHSEEDTIRQQQLTFLQQALQGMQKVLLLPDIPTCVNFLQQSLLWIYFNQFHRNFSFPGSIQILNPCRFWLVRLIIHWFGFLG